MTRIAQYKDETLGRFIQSRPDFKWDFGKLSLHPDLTLRVLEMFPDSPWNWVEIAFNNPKFKWEWVTKLPNKQWPWTHFQFHEDFVWRWVHDTQDKPWDWRALSHYIVSCNTISYFREQPWDWLVLTLSDTVSTDFIMAHYDFPWVIGELFFRKINKDTIRYLRMFKDRYTPHDWKDHTMHATWQVIKENMDLPWDLESIKWKPGDLGLGDIEFLEKNQQNLDMKKISEIVNYHGLVKGARGSTVDWDLEGLSRNPTFTNLDLPQNIERYDLNLVRVRDETHKWHAAQTIKRHWKRAITDPKRKMCRDVFLRYMVTLDSILH